jgi:hypothetical protein
MYAHGRHFPEVSGFSRIYPADHGADTAGDGGKVAQRKCRVTLSGLLTAD